MASVTQYALLRTKETRFPFYDDEQVLFQARAQVYPN